MTSSSLSPAPSPALDRVGGALFGTRLAGESESWLQCFLMDGVLDAVEYAAQGVGADDVACAWLGGLCWVAALDSAVPDGAPQPPPREFATAAAAPAAAAGAGDPQNLIGLRSPEMSQPRRPFNRPAATVPELAATDGTGVLARGAAMGLLAQAEIADVRRLASWTAAFSHGSPAAHEAAADAAELLYRLTDSSPEEARELLDSLAWDDAGQHPDDESGFGTARAGLVAAVEVVRPATTGAFGAAEFAALQRLGERDAGAGACAGALIGAFLGAQALAAASGQEPEAVLGQATERLARSFTQATLG